MPQLADRFLGQSTRAVLWQNSQIQDLSTLGGPTGQAFGINNTGQIVGQADTAQYTLISTVGRTLPNHKAAASTDPPGTKRLYTAHAFLWQNGTMTDLNTLIAAKTGWVLLDASAINNKGQIVGGGLYKGKGQIFLLTPR